MYFGGGHVNGCTAESAHWNVGGKASVSFGFEMIYCNWRAAEVIIKILPNFNEETIAYIFFTGFPNACYCFSSGFSNDLDAISVKLAYMQWLLHDNPLNTLAFYLPARLNLKFPKCNFFICSLGHCFSKCGP